MLKTPFAFKGLMVPVLTPFDSNRTLRLDFIPQYAEYLSNNKINGVLVNGTTGEGPSMSVSERKLVAEAWANEVKTTKQHLMVQIGGAPIPDVLELAKHAESIKVDSLLCLPELYFKPTNINQLIEYLKLVSKAAPNTPLLYYHIPMLTNVNVHMGEFLESLGEQIPNFVGIKFTSTNLEESAQALNVNNKKYVVFLGNDQLIMAGSAIGIESFIATGINMFPELTLEILAEWKAENILKARQKQEEYSKAVTAISKYGSWIATMKTAMHLLTNIDVGPTRAVWDILSPEKQTSMANDLKNLGYQIRK